MKLLIVNFLLIICVIIAAIIVAGAYTTKQANLAFAALGKSYPPYPKAIHSESIGGDSAKPPVVCHVSIHDLDKDGNNEIIFCDTQEHGVYMRRFINGEWQETAIAKHILAPAHATVCDFDKDGDLDILVADLGDVFPNDLLVGSVLLLENNDLKFTKHVLIKDLGRVADVQCADFDADGDNDLALAVFGHGRGEVVWLEQDKDRQFIKHQLLDGPGSIHVPCEDFDNDGDIDIACVLSQDEEEVWILENTGHKENNKRFNKHLLFRTLNNDLGSAGLVAHDIDKDGDQDLILPTGDNLEEFFHYPQQYHGCYLFENTGGLHFKQKQISDLPGCYAASCGDFDGDGHDDIALLSMVNDWDDPNSASVVLLKHDGALQFTPLQIASQPICFITCCFGDANNDQRIDLIAGAFCIQAPFDRSSRLHLWTHHE